jgi:hypothetical protein
LRGAKATKQSRFAGATGLLRVARDDGGRRRIQQQNVPAFSKAASLRHVDIQTFISGEFRNNITQL